MKKALFGTILLALVVTVPLQTMAGVDISINIGLPPPLVFPAPPAVIVLPDTDDVYAVPDIDVDLFFWGGWWWRLWDGRWYRSRYYDRGWAHYRYVPIFYYDVDPGWRGYYHGHNWYGHPWYYERIDHQRLQRNWQSWHNNRHWQRQQTWGVQNYRPRPQLERQELRRERERHYQQRPDVQRYQQQRPQPQPQRRPQVQQPRQQPQDWQQQRQERRPETRHPQRSRPQGRFDRGQEERRK